MNSEQESWHWGNRIRGGNIRNQVRDALLAEYNDELTAKGLKVEILRFATPEYEAPLDTEQQDRVASYQAAEDSRRVKTASFRALGIEVPDREFLPQTMEKEEFQALIEELNVDPSVNAIIVQYPVPSNLTDLVRTIAPEKDLDALSENPTLFTIPATSEGIMRVVEPFTNRIDATIDSRVGNINIQAEAIVRVVEAFAHDDVTVAVVGARGFVGRGVVQLLDERNVQYIAIDQRDQGYQESDLLRVREADIIISATGQCGILDERHLTPYHRLVVDCGYVPIENDRYGDIARSAATIPQNITPVPNGTGPIEMAILMERIVRKEIDPDLMPWRLQDYQSIHYYDRETLSQKQQEWATAIYPIAEQWMLLNQNRLERTSSRILKLDASPDYKLILNSQENSLSIEGKNNRGELAKFNPIDGQVYSAIGLTELERQNWQAIARSIAALQRQQNQSRNQQNDSRDFER